MKRHFPQPYTPSLATNFDSWKFLWRYLSPHRNVLMSSIFLAALQSISLLPVALLVRSIFDSVIPSGRMTSLLWHGLALLVLYLVNSSLILLTRQQTITLTNNTIHALRTDFIDHVYRFSHAQFHRHDRGILHTRLVQETERISALISALSGSFIPALAISLILSLVLLYLNWALFLGLVLVMPFLVLLFRKFGRRVYRGFDLYHRAFERFNKSILFMLQVMGLTQAQANVSHERAQQGKVLDNLHANNRSVSWLANLYRITQDLIVTLAGLAALLLGAAGVIRGWITLGEVFSFYITLALLTRYLATMLGTLTEIISGSESLNTLHTLLQEEPEISYRGKRRVEFTGNLRLNNLSFGYEPGEEARLLRGVNLDIVSESITTVIGANGSGKTTLAALILGLHRPQVGELYAEGFPYSEIDLPDLRRQIGSVSQNPLLFSGTVAENISYGNPQATPADLQAASDSATALEFIQALPAGFDTLVGDEAIFLSGGQRQRIAIARALLHRPRLLILDEPTNHLDLPSATTLIQNLRSLKPAPAILIITHDQQLLQHANQVLLLQNGTLQRSQVSANS